jgi:hypothetical protein
MNTMEARQYSAGAGLVEHFSDDLGQIKLLAPDKVEFSGQEFPLTTNGQRSLCKLLEIPNNFNTRLHSDSTSLWEEMVKKLEILREQPIRVSLVKSEIPNGKQLIESFNPAELGWIDTEQFLNMVDFWLDFAPVKLSLKHVYMDSYGNSMAQFTFPNVEGTILSDPTDIFRLGLTLTNSETVHTRSSIGLAVERMVCTNRAMAPDKDYVVMCKHTKGSQRLIEDLWSSTQQLVMANVSIQKFIEERVNRLVGVKASVRELEAMSLMLKKTIPDISLLVPDVETRIPIESVAAKYGVDFSTKSDHWKSTASTPVDMYELYNQVTWIGSNTELHKEVREELEIKIGSTFLSADKAPDMLDVAPARNWN